MSKWRLETFSCADGRRIRHPQRWDSVCRAVAWVILGLGLGCVKFNIPIKHSKIKVSEISIVVATEDPSRTAIMYGVISQAVSYMLELLGRFTTLKRSYKGTISVVPDFTKEDSSIKLDLLLQQRLWHILGLIISTFIHIMKDSDLLKSKSKKITKNRRNKKCQKTN